MIRMVSGRQIDVPEEPDGTTDMGLVRQEMALSPQEILIEAKPNGENFILPFDGTYRMDRDSALQTAPLIKRGKQA